MRDLDNACISVGLIALLIKSSTGAQDELDIILNEL